MNAANRGPTLIPAPPKGALAWLLGLPIYLYRARMGFLFGHRFLLLVTEGRRTGRRREAPLEVARYDRARHEAIVVAAWGQKTQWLHNLEAGLAREVWIGRERFVPTFRILEVDEAISVLEQYEDHNGIPKAVVRAVLSRLLGWRYDGSPAARRRAVEQLPLVGLRPVEAGARPAVSRVERPPRGC
jgi:deazaflavin-dependent oxidoreductase (nitroreductase family)